MILTPGFPVNEQDSTCLPAIQQFILSAKKIYPANKILILSFQYPFLRKDYYWNEVRVIALAGQNRPGLARALTWIRAYGILRTLNKKESVSGLLSLWLTECSLVAKWFAKLNSITHYMWIQGQDAKKSNQYIKRIKPSAQNIIAISEFSQNDFLKNHGQNPFMVAHNGIDPAKFPQFNFGERKIDILGVGSLIPLKNWDLFIRQVAHLKEHKPNIKAIVAGAGVEQQKLRNLIRSLNLESNITMLGEVPHSAVLNLMAESRFLLHPSSYEGNSTVMIEALYSGCIVFATQTLSGSPVKNLVICGTEEDYFKKIKDFILLEVPHEQVLFNTMDKTAEKILKLFPSPLLSR